ncbi:MAG: RES domain-containing protein [Bacteroidetes bacterium]|nr:RES domain-containing protein [Bacteroidota bacterium]
MEKFKDLLKKWIKILCIVGDEFGDETDFYTDEWNYFKEVVKHKARFVFYFDDVFKGYFHSNPILILNNIQSEIIKLNLFKTITPSTAIYRCTQHINKNDVKADGKRIASNPVANCKGQNRMSPAGISMFYGSDDNATCIREVVDFTNLKEPFYTIAKFTPKQNLKLIDLTSFPVLPSIFDSVNNKYRESIMFLKAFAKDLSKHIHKNDTSIEYVPTQVITEYIKFNPKLKVDGIIYPSAKDNSISNYVLFMDNDESLEKLNFYFSNIQVKHI